MFTFMFAVTRVWFSMSRDGLLPKWSAKVDSKRRVPVRVTWIVGIGSGLIAGFLPIAEAAELTIYGLYGYRRAHLNTARNNGTQRISSSRRRVPCPHPSTAARPSR